MSFANFSLELCPLFDRLSISTVSIVGGNDCRSVAQLVSALAWGARGRPFESARSDHTCMEFLATPMEREE